MLAEFFDLVGQPNLRGTTRGGGEDLRDARPGREQPGLGMARCAEGEIPLGDNEGGTSSPAVLLARKPVALAPGEAMYGNTLGLALYRDGRIAEARIGPGGQPRPGQGVDGRLGSVPPGHVPAPPWATSGAARISYDKAVAWRKSHAGRLKGDASELADLEAEAGRLVGAAK